MTNEIAIKVLRVEGNAPAGKVADVEIAWLAGSVLAGLKLQGFAVWERRGGGGRNVTFPARTYSVNGERRTFALLRPINDTADQEPIRAAILEAVARELGELAAAS